MATDAISEPRTLLVEPDTLLRRTWESALRGRGHIVMGTGQIDAARVLAESFHPDVIVWNTNGINGDGGVRSLRESTDAYIVAVGHDVPSERRVVLLTAGADAVLPLPCPPNELLAQTAALLRRPRSVVVAPKPSGTRRRFGPLEIDVGRRESLVNGKRLSVTRIEFDILSHLCNHPHEVVSRADLVNGVWGPDWSGDTHMVDVHVSNLRRKLEQAAPGVPIIQTVRGMGFRLASEVVDGPTL
jgi:two-component system OmpR family response regulator